jgi:hypothetical protein
LFAVGCEDNPNFSGANPTVYTNLWLQIKSKLLAGETGSEPPRRIYFAASFRASSLTHETLLPHHGCGHRGDGACAFRKPTGSCRQHSFGSKVNLSSLLLVIVLERENRIDPEQEHEHDYEGGGAPK